MRSPEEILSQMTSNSEWPARGLGLDLESRDISKDNVKDNRKDLEIGYR